MADEATDQTDTTEAETSATETAETTAETQQTETGAENGDDKSLMGAVGKKAGESETGKTEEEGKDETPALPEKYELTAPEGTEIDERILAEADPVFRELGLNNDQANKLMPLAGKFAEKLQQASLDAHLAMAADWAKKAQADKEIGGKNWGETEAAVARALDKFGAPEGSPFRKLLDDTKLGNHPEMIRMFAKIGKAIGEDGDFVRADGGAAIKPDRLAALYPDDVPKEGVS